MAYETLKIEKADGVALLSFNRPDKKNAMNPQLHEDMTNALEELRYDDEAKVVVITGAGDSFCAGMDLKEVFHALKDQPARYDKVIRLATEWRGRTLRYFPKPTIAMVNGYCFGGAFSIVEGCDLAIAADEATFGLSEINFKGFPGGAVSKSLANLLRPRDALFYAPAAGSAARSRRRSGWSTSRSRWRSSSRKPWPSRATSRARTRARSKPRKTAIASRWR
jgi:trans-feruloyl-CoA hydratase/vanillin synthase